MKPEPIPSAWLPPVEARPRTIAFTSGKGGVGKSNLVLNTALLLARRGRRVAILDGDLGLASLNVLLGLAPRYDLRDVLDGSKRLAEILVRGPHGLILIPAGSGVAELANLEDEDRDELLVQLREIEESVDFFLIDTGAGISDTVLNLIVASDEAVVVTQPEPTSLADAYALMKVVVQHNPGYPFHVLVNRVTGEAQARQIFQALSDILMRFLGYRPGDAGFVPDDPAVGQGVVQQVPFTILSPRAPATRSLEALAGRLAGPAPAERAERQTFWARVSSWRRGK